MEDKKIKVLEELAKQSDEEYMKILKNNGFTKLLKAIGLFPDQAISNDILILSQKPDATCVKRMKEWNYYGRSVKPSEKSIKVISHYLEKFDQDYTDETGKVFAEGIDKMRTDVGYLFDISQTQGKEYNPLYSNIEVISKHFDVAKQALERTARDYKFEYKNIDETVQIDKENKTVTIKDGIDLSDVIYTLIDKVSEILLETRRPEGLTKEDKENIDDIEHKATIYAIHTKLGLKEPEFDFEEVSKMTDTQMISFKDNLQKVRSVAKQLLSNFERDIEKAERNINKSLEKLDAVSEEDRQKILDKFYADMNFGTDSKLVTINKVTKDKVDYTFNGTTSVYEITKEKEQETPKPKRTRAKTKQTESEVE